MSNSGERIETFTAIRRISYDGECYHCRIPIKLIKSLRKHAKTLEKVAWNGIWKKDGKVLVVLSFEENKSDSKNDYVTLGKE